MTVALESLRAAFAALEARADVAPSVTARRREAFGAFVGAGLPTRKDEEWRYTNVAAIGGTAFALPSGLDDSSVDAALAAVGVPSDGPLALFVAGRLDPRRSRLDGGGATIRPLREHLDDTRITDAIGGDDRRPRSAFDALRAAFVDDGLVIDVSANTELDAPLHIVHIGPRGGGPWIAPTQLVVTLGENARATIIESFVGEVGATFLRSSGVSIRLSSGAALDHWRLQDEPTGAFHLAATDVNSGRDAAYRTFTLSAGAQIARDDLAIRVDGPGAHTDIAALYVPGSGQSIDHHTLIDHRAPSCTADQLYKGIIDDDGHAIFNGKVFVRREAQQTSANQLNQNLMLSRESRVDTKPQLEIFADDVRCTHGATVGQLDPEELFYLMSRAVPTAAARRMLIRGFAAEALGRVSDAALSARFATVLDRKLHPEPADAK